MAKNQFRNFLFMAALVLLAGCSLKTRHADQGLGPMTSGPKPGLVLKQDETKPAEPEAAPTPNSGTPTVSNSQITVIPKFGFIFSGGGAKAWAHIGVLKEMQKLKWPVSSVAGVEWGAVVAATYAQNLSANEVEWELSKLKDFEKFDQFIKAAFAKKATADLKIPFVCPSLNIAKQNVYLLNRGQMDQLLPFCVPSPGLIKPVSQSMASMADVSSLAQHLRATGATRIILVNVLAQETKRSFLKDYESADNILWVQSAALMSKKPVGVDDTIDINLDNFGIKDLDKRREIIAKGSELSYNQLKKLADKYGL